MGGQAVSPTLMQIGGQAVSPTLIQIGGQAVSPTLIQIGGQAVSQILYPIMAVKPPTFNRAAGSSWKHLFGRKKTIHLSKIDSDI